MLKVGKRDAGAGLTKGHATKNDAELRALLLATRSELDDIRAKYTALLAKLDADFTAQNAAVAGSQLDVDYASSGALAAATFEE